MERKFSDGCYHTRVFLRRWETMENSRKYYYHYLLSLHNTQHILRETLFINIYKYINMYNIIFYINRIVQCTKSILRRNRKITN